MSSDQRKFHYVQKAYLKNFSRDSHAGEVYALEKKTLMSRPKGVNKIAFAEYFFYETMENIFNKEFETKTPKIFNKIKNGTIKDLNTTDREVLAKFVNYHILRTKDVRLQIEAELELSGEHYSEEDMKKLHDSTIRVFSDDYKRLLELQFRQITWKKGPKFVTSDVPVVIENFKTPNNMQSYWCYSDGFIAMLPIDPNNIVIYINTQRFIKQEDLINVLSHPNYLQAIHSTEYIYSNIDEFKEIISIIQAYKLKPLTIEDRKNGISKLISSYPLEFDYGVDLWDKLGNRTYYSIYDEMRKQFRRNSDEKAENRT